MNHYIKNLETGKIQLHFDYSDYQSLSQEQKKEIKSAFLWSRFASAWVSRAKDRNTYYAEQIAKKLNLEYKGEEGEKPSFEEQVERTQQRAEGRAERMEVRAEKAEQQADSAYNKAKQIGDCIPMGQPILVGHHSEKRHRRDIEKMDNNMRKSVEASEKAGYYQDRAETARHTASGDQYKSPVYLGNRIRESEAALRKLNNYLTGIGYINKETGEVSTIKNPFEIEEKRKEYLQNRITEETEKINFYKEKLVECGFVLEDKKSLQEKRITHIKYSKTWYPVASFNSKTVTILNWLSVAGFGWKVAYTDIKEIKSQDEMYIVYDRDHNEVKPKVKYQ